VRIRRHVSYANVIATLALLFSLAGGAYAITEINSHDIVNGSIKSIDLKNRKGVKAADVRPNALTGKQIDESTLNGGAVAPIAGDESGDCDPASSTAFVDCAKSTIHLKQKSRLLAIATGNQESNGSPAKAICEVQIDGQSQGLAVQPGEEATDNTSSLATNGFARTVVSRARLPAGSHEVALACKEFSGDVRIDVPTIAAIAVGSG
jgi:hypothetical protein